AGAAAAGSMRAVGGAADADRAVALGIADVGIVQVHAVRTRNRPVRTQGPAALAQLGAAARVVLGLQERAAHAHRAEAIAGRQAPGGVIQLLVARLERAELVVPLVRQTDAQRPVDVGRTH